MKNLEIVDEIYKKIFCNMNHGNIDLFLCGGASTKGKNSYRDAIRKELEKDIRLSILYPEDMFMDLLDRKKYDLLTLENFLANDSDLILIVCESPGSFAELGAFVNNNDILEKVVVLIQSKYKNAKSFIRQGPVEYVRSKNRNNVIFYNNNMDETIKGIRKYIKNQFGKSGDKEKKTEFKDLNLISGQFCFIILLLYFYQKLHVEELVEAIKRIYKITYNMQEFEIIYSSAIKRLFKQGLIKKIDLTEKGIQYTLTDKGFEFVNKLLSFVYLENKVRVINKIRLSIIYSQCY